jgi:glucuronosyltransferase
MKNVSLVLVNHHFSTSSIRPFVANMIEIGGIHVEPVKPLPNDIKEFLDSATDGVILFSMGSIIQGKDWEPAKRKAFVKAFGKLKQKVLWKYENETLPNKPSNVMISPWIPQRDILAHPNMELFITHGGLLGTTEALVEGVPVLGIPVYGDQKMNMLKAENFGYGILMEIDEIDQDLIEKNLQKLLTNPQYKRNAVKVSKRYNDRPMTPHQLTVYWVEYVIRHHGAPHFQSPAHRLNYLQLNLIDVYAFLFISVILLIIVIFRLLKFMIRSISNVCSDKKVKMN